MTDLVIRDAVSTDLPEIVRLLAQDQIGGDDSPGPPLDPGYAAAFEAIARDPNQRLLIAEQGGRIAGTFQLTFTPGLLYQGGWRCTIEGVRVDAAMRGRRIGEAMMAWAIAQSKARGCRLIQLSSNLARADAHRFYERLGWAKSHAGFKMHLTEAA